MTSFATLEIEHGAVARVRMNRPQVFNAFDETMIGELDGAFSALGADPSVRVIRRLRATRAIRGRRRSSA